MPVIAYYTCLLQIILVTVRLHLKLFAQLAGVMGTLSLILILLDGPELLNYLASLAGGMLAMLGYSW